MPASRLRKVADIYLPADAHASAGCNRIRAYTSGYIYSRRDLPRVCTLQHIRIVHVLGLRLLQACTSRYLRYKYLGTLRKREIFTSGRKSKLFNRLTQMTTTTMMLDHVSNDDDNGDKNVLFCVDSLACIDERKDRSRRRPLSRP